MAMKTRIIAGLILFALSLGGLNASPRDRILMDFDWKFALGHAGDPRRDFNHGTAYFTYLAKAGYGDGPAAANFDDRSWRPLDLPHDWVAELPFAPNASHSHGYKTVGYAFPEYSVGWYRKHFVVEEKERGRRFFLEFDGVFRNARVWVNGFYCGNEPSGYTSFGFDITEYLNFGGSNVIAVRVDASLEEGWFYEGAGIYRHVWLTSTKPLYVPQYGTFVRSELRDNDAAVYITTEVRNKYQENTSFRILNIIKDREGREVARTHSVEHTLRPQEGESYDAVIEVEKPRLWDIDDPYLYSVESCILLGDTTTDIYTTSFGIRTIEWTADKGFFLNGRHVKLKGTNNHQNHAGVGSAMPDALIEWRLGRLKAMGCNAYRTAHYPPSPALLDAADRMGILVLCENRLMGTTDQVLDYLRRLIIRDRNHPSIIAWSIGNEEWAIENNERGAAMATLMQDYAKLFDNTRPINAAVSGSWGRGISSVVELMGYNYLFHGNTDLHHERFPWQFSVGTEEGSTNTTRGIYEDDPEKQYLAAYDRDTPSGFFAIRKGWQHYAARDYLAGMFIWTGFDYRGEPTPFRYPSVVSYFGMYDLCGFPKDNVYYLKSWWTNEEVLHILPHWNWQGREGEPIDVWVYSNMDEVELFLNNKSLGRKTMEKNSYLSWEVPFKPGSIKAVAFKDGKKRLVKVVETTGKGESIKLEADKTIIKADRMDLAVVTVKIIDNKGRTVPDAENLVSFDISGPARIIGVGNGDPTSLEPDQFVPQYKRIKPGNWKSHQAEGIDVDEAVRAEFDAVSWEAAFQIKGLEPGSQPELTVYKGSFTLTQEDIKGQVTWLFNSIATGQSVYLNGQLIAKSLSDSSNRHSLRFDPAMLKVGDNHLVILGYPLVKQNIWDEMNTDPGEILIYHAAPQWQRKTFNGLAQVIIQSDGEPGDIVLKAKGEKLKASELRIEAR